MQNASVLPEKPLGHSRESAVPSAFFDGKMYCDHKFELHILSAVLNFCLKSGNITWYAAPGGFDKMNATDAKKRIDELTELLNRLSYRYYVENDSDVSDYDYDKMSRELIGLEKDFPEFKRPHSP